MPDMSRRTLYAISGTAFAAMLLLAPPALAQKKYDEGATDTEIKIGNTAPYSGNASAYGLNARTIEAFFKMINDKGGVNGRKINFITYDDAYSPPKTVEMVRKLVEEDKVLFVFYTLGTAPNTAIHKYLNQRKIPQVFVATGASKWGDPKNFPWTLGWQPDYATEGAIYAKHILATVKDPKIAVLMQNDDMGRDYFNGFKSGLGTAGEKLIVQLSTYEVTDPTADSQVLQLKNSGANVFFNITTPKFAAQAIRKSAEIGWKPAHYLANVSASLGSVLKPAGYENGQGIITARYFVDPTDPATADHPDVLAFKTFMQKYMPSSDLKDLGHASGYVTANGMLEVLKRCGDDLSRANVMKQATSLHNVEVPLLLKGIKVNTSPTDFFPLQSVQLARLAGEKWELFGDVISHEQDSN